MVDLNINFTVKVPGLKKLSDVVASGVGAVAGSMVAPWIAERRARATRIEAQAEADSLRLIAQAQADARKALGAPDEGGTVAVAMTAKSIAARLEFQEAKRQLNIVAVVRQAAEELGDDEVPDSEPNHDWIASFFRIRPGRLGRGCPTHLGKDPCRRSAPPGRRFPADALESAELLARRGGAFRRGHAVSPGRLHPAQVVLGMLGHPESRRLLLQVPGAGIVLHSNGPAPASPPVAGHERHRPNSEPDQVLAIAGKPNSSLDLADDAVIMKPPGIELAPFCGASTDTTYLRHFARLLAGKECVLWALPIEETTAESHVVSLERMRMVEPV